MAALRFSFLAIFFLCSCAYSQGSKNIVVESRVEGCFSFISSALDMNQEPLLLVASIKPNAGNKDCPCKSAVMKYTAYQKKNGDIFNLMSGNFSVLGKDKVVLPVAVQKQLVFPDVPIQLSLSCSGS